MQDDDETAHDLAAPPSYADAPATIEARPSPFHHLAGQFAPVITSKTPTSPGPAEVVLVPPMAFAGEVDPMAGPTAPEGHPISGSFDAATDPGFPGGPWIDSTPTVPGQPMPMPVLPPPEGPSILVSQSLMLEAASPDTEVTRPSQPLPAAPVRRRHSPQHGPGPHAPTEVALPAIKRKKKPKEGTDTMLILGLVGVGLLIAIMVAAISYAVVRSVAPRRVERATIVQTV